MFSFKPKSLIVGLAAILSLTTSPLSAEQVTLNSLDGTVSMTGELLDYDGVTYMLGMLVGEISIDASQVECEGAGCPNAAAGLTSFSIAGAGELAENLMPTLIEVFALARGGDLDVAINADGSRTYSVLEPDGAVYADITVLASDTRNGFASIMEGSAVISMAARPVSATEASAFELSGKGKMNSPAQERIVAMNGVIAAVNPQNPVQVLSLDQLGSIFEGRTTNWAQLGGPNAPISLYRRAESADTTEAFAAMAMAPNGHVFTPSATILNSDSAVSDSVSADIYGIGITSFAAERNAQPVTLRSVCGELFEPSVFSIQTEAYPLTQRMYLYTDSKALPDVATTFLEFAGSAEAQGVIANAGFVDQSASRAGLDAQGRRLAQAIVSSSGRTELLQLQDLASIMLDADRLSFTLHYDDNGALDTRARADIARLAEMIKEGRFSSRQMLIFGFSDNARPVNAQLISTQAVAQTVRDEIVAATGRASLGNLRISPIGYGRLMPLGCNETDYGRRNNNRVEIWVK